MLRKVNVTLGIAAVVTGFAGYANAGCSSAGVNALPSSWQQSLGGQGEGQLVPAALKVYEGSSIVGMWQFTFTAKGNVSALGPPDGAPIDSGYVTWHSDGTELMNSGRAPTTGDFCMGVWQQVGPATYKLNHFALAWDFDAEAPVTGPGTGGADFVGPVNIRETITLDRGGMSYHGTFGLVQYDQDKNVLADIVGTVTATRITVNTAIAN